MPIRRRVVILVLASALLLAVSTGSGAGSPAHALPESRAQAAGPTIPYAGRLDDEAGQPVADGAYDFTFSLYGTETGGEPLWSEVQTGLTVSQGDFLTTLGRVVPLSAAALNGQVHWLAVSVRGPGEARFTALAPRQRLDAAAPTSPAASAACPHDHFANLWVGDNLWGLTVSNANDSLNAVGILGVGQTGVRGGSTNGTGVYGDSTNGAGVYGNSANSNGVYAQSASGGSSKAALRANSTAASCGIAAYLTNNSGCPTLEIDKRGAGGVAIDLQVFDPGTGQDGGHYIIGYDQNVTKKFQISGSGVIAAEGYTTWASDLAEMLPAVEGSEPGDVLVIGPDGKLDRCSAPYQTSVAGVYSTQPGFVGGQPIEGEVEGAIPLAVVGIVPVKVSAENGPIQPGDLLVASGTAGHAMRAGASPPQGSVIGKALEKWDQGTGLIQMLATLQ